jgi:predicted CXXCH cytochrome family protein
MLLADQKTVCLKCHANQGKAAAGARTVHEAFSSGDCTKCHSPHKASLQKLMLAKTPDVCTTCHKTMKQKIAAEKAHSPADDCLTCHAPHASAQPRLATQPVLELCGQCHEAKDKAFASAHLGIAAKDMSCASCHDPHSSKDAKFFKATVHAPFRARECNSCHNTGK